MAAKKIHVTRESSSGRNQNFKVPGVGNSVSRAKLVKRIEQGKHPGYHVRRINNLKTPVSNPDRTSNNNSG